MPRRARLHTTRRDRSVHTTACAIRRSCPPPALEITIPNSAPPVPRRLAFAQLCPPSPARCLQLHSQHGHMGMTPGVVGMVVVVGGRWAASTRHRGVRRSSPCRHEPPTRGPSEGCHHQLGVMSPRLTVPKRPLVSGKTTPLRVRCQPTPMRDRLESAIETLPTRTKALRRQAPAPAGCATLPRVALPRCTAC